MYVIMVNHYETLGVEPNASQDESKRPIVNYRFSIIPIGIKTRNLMKLYKI